MTGVFLHVSTHVRDYSKRVVCCARLVYSHLHHIYTFICGKKKSKLHDYSQALLLCMRPEIAKAGALSHTGGNWAMAGHLNRQISSGNQEARVCNVSTT
ncbi:unnamed protein product [Ectocarpus sp. 12 AP-2014]